MKTNQSFFRYKNQNYEIVALTESQRCRQHEAVLVSEAEADANGKPTVPVLPGRKVLHCPFCRPGGPS